MGKTTGYTSSMLLIEPNDGGGGAEDLELDDYSIVLSSLVGGDFSF